MFTSHFLSKKYYAIALMLFAFIAPQMSANAQLKLATDNTPPPLSNAESHEHIEVIEVTGINYSSLNTETLNRDEFVNTAGNLSDVLQNVNGIQIRQIGGIGNPVAVSIRGSSSKQVKLYIDGQLINDSQFGGFDLNQIPTENIESIEISKNQSSGTGATPIGGAIRINTYNPGKNITRLSLGVGTLGYKEANLLSNFSFKNYNISFGLNTLTADNDYKYTVPKSFKSGLSNTREKIVNNEFSKHSLFVNSNAQLGNHQNRLVFQYGKQNKALPNYQLNIHSNKSSLTSEHYRFSYQHYWHSSLQGLDAIEFDSHVEYKDEHYLRNLDIEDEEVVNGYYDTTKYFSGVTAYLEWAILNSSLKLEPYFTIAQQEFSTETTYSTGNSNTTCGLRACDIIANQQQINTGVKLQVEMENTPLNFYALINSLTEENKNEELNSTTPRPIKINRNYNSEELGLTYQWRQLTTSFNWSNGIRTPTMYELFGDRGSFEGNDELLPESAQTFSLSSQYKSKQFFIRAAVYQQSLEDTIVALFNNGVGSYTNVSDSELIGFEFQSSTELTKDLSVTLQTHLIDSTIFSDKAIYDQKQLPGVYHQQYSLAVQYELTNAWRLNIKTSADKELHFNRINQAPNNYNAEGYGPPSDRTITDLSTSWKSSMWNISLSIHNLFNASYQDLANREDQGRSVQLKFSIEDI